MVSRTDKQHKNGCLTPWKLNVMRSLKMESDLFGQLLCGVSCFLHFPSFEMKNGKKSIAL